MSSTATTGSTGTQKSCATLNTTLTTIPETEPDIIQAERQGTGARGERRGRAARDKQWVFQGKVQGSIIFRQYYPEGGWGCVILLVGVIMMFLTSGTQLSLGVLVRPAIWKFKPSLLSFVSLSGLSLSVSMALSPLVVAFCKVPTSYYLYIHVQHIHLLLMKTFSLSNFFIFYL